MIDLNHIDELARRLSGLVPPGLRGDTSQGLRDELQQNFKSVLQAGLSKLDLVTREEFEVQRAVAELESQVDGVPPTGAAPDSNPLPPRH